MKGQPSKKRQRASFTTCDMWDKFKAVYDPELATRINYKIFKEVVVRFNKKARDGMIEGEVLPMGYGLGRIYVRYVNKKATSTYHTRRPDWMAIHEYAKQNDGKKIMIWQVMKDYCFIYWRRFPHPNIYLYYFKVAKNCAKKEGMPFMLANKINSDPLVILKYKTE